MANTKTRESNTTPAAEPKAEPEIVEVARAWTETLRDAGKAVADTAIAMQDSNAHFTQMVIDQGLKQVEDQATALRKLYGTLTSQSDAQRAAFRDLGREAVEAYIGLLTTPVKLARRAAETAWDAAEQTTEADA